MIYLQVDDQQRTVTTYVFEVIHLLEERVVCEFGLEVVVFPRVTRFDIAAKIA